MEKKKENKLVMLNATMSLLQQKRDKWKDMPPLLAATETVKGLLDQLELQKQLVGSDQTGQVIAKDNIQENLIASAFELSSLMTAFAAQTNDPVLQAKVDFPISKLRNMRDNKLGSFCRSLLKLASERETVLQQYGISATQISDLSTSIEAYEQQLPNHRISVSERKAANEKMKTLVSEAMQVTSDQLDRLMIKFKTTDPDFYTAYLNARKIVDYGIRHEKPVPGPMPL